MRIFYAVGRKPNQGLSVSNVWRSNLLLALQDLGHDVIEFQYDLEPFYANADLSYPNARSFVSANQNSLERALIKQVVNAHRKQPIDLFFSYFYSSFVKPSFLIKLRDLGIPTMNWYCNAAHQFDLIKDIAPYYDYSLVPEKFRLPDYRRVGANPIYCQEAANPQIYQWSRSDCFDYEVSFVGSPGANRPEYIHALVKSGVNINVWGVRWNSYSPPLSFTSRLRWFAARLKKRLHGTQPLPILPDRILHPPISDQEMISIYGRSKISLGFTTTNNLKNDPSNKQVRLREFEATMSGAFYLLEYIEDIEDFFEVGKEIVCFESKSDLIEKINYYLNHEEEREAIREAGHARALRDHTWQKRFQKVFSSIGLE